VFARKADAAVTLFCVNKQLEFTAWTASVRHDFAQLFRKDDVFVLIASDVCMILWA